MNQKCREDILSWPRFSGYCQKWVNVVSDSIPWITLSDESIKVQSVHADRLVGQVDKVSAIRAEDPGFKSCLHWDISGSSHTSDLKIGVSVATLPGVWRYRVSAETGWSGISILRLGEMESLICNFYLSVAAHQNCLSRSVSEIHLHVAGMLSNQQTNCACMHSIAQTQKILTFMS